MRIEDTGLEGLKLITPAPHADARGLFARVYDAAAFAAAGLPTDWPQCSISFNHKRGTLRGLHFQADPLPEPKLVRCARGAIYDVAVDIRSTSVTYLRWFAAELTEDNRQALYIPPGFAHGFLTLRDGTEVDYQIGATYAPELARGRRWNDPAFAIDWPFAPIVISERDAQYPDHAHEPMS